jgi:hypothetical protein
MKDKTYMLLKISIEKIKSLRGVGFKAFHILWCRPRTYNMNILEKYNKKNC